MFKFILNNYNIREMPSYIFQYHGNTIGWSECTDEFADEINQLPNWVVRALASDEERVASPAVNIKEIMCTINALHQMQDSLNVVQQTKISTIQSDIKNLEQEISKHQECIKQLEFSILAKKHELLAMAFYL